jgi:branched-chain amino acid transport system substrate-binding protein
MNRWLPGLAGCLLSFALQAGQPPVQAEPIRLAAVFSYSGRNVNNDDVTVRVIRQMVVMQNARGGLLGRPIELLELDTASRAAGGKLLAQQAINAGVSAVIGANLSAQSLAIAPALQQAGIPMISPASTVPELTQIGDYIFRTNFTDDDQGIAMAQFAAEHLHAKTAVVITDVSQKYSQNLSGLFMQQFRQRGGQVLWQAEIIQNSVSFHGVLRKIRLLAPDVLLVAAYGQEAGMLMRQMDELKLQKPVICGDGCSADLGKIGAQAPYKLYSVVYWHPDLHKAGDPELALTGFSTRQQLGAAIAFDAVSLIFNAIRAANSSEPARIRQALQNPWQGVTGLYHFGRSRDPHKAVVFVRHDSEGPVLERAMLPQRPAVPNNKESQ